MDKDQNLRVYDSNIPALVSGTYVINVKQKLKSGGSAIGDEEIQQSRQMVLEGSFYSLDKNSIVNIYPPRGSRGEYDAALPFMVIKDPSFPWRRFMTYSGKRIPWVTLLTLEKGEGLFESGVPVKDYLKTPPAGELRNRIPKNQPSANDAVCDTLAMPAALFKCIAPYACELPYLVHCRMVGTANKVEGILNDEGDCSVVISQRFPAGGKAGKNMELYLVSFEGLNDFLPPAKSVTGYDRVRLLVLARSDFYSETEKHEGFIAAARLLKQDNQEAYLFRLPDYGQSLDSLTRERSLSKERLERGYIPISYHARTGEHSYGWIRTLFIPEQPVISRGSDTFSGADSAMIYDREYGIFDFTLANAFETGRLIALADPDMGNGLRKLRIKGQVLTDRAYRYLHGGYAGEQELEQTIENGYLLRHSLKNISDEMWTEIGVTPPLSKLTYSESPVAFPAGEDEFAGLRLFFEDHRAFVKKALAEEVEFLCDWLKQLYLCDLFTRDTLVYDKRLLPEQSIRFFYIDDAWVEACFDGSLSLGMDSSRHEAFQSIIKELVYERLADREGGLGTGVISGALLNASLVEWWPNMDIHAFAPDGGELKPLKIRMLDTAVMLMLFPGIPVMIRLEEPKEGMTLGLSEQGLFSRAALTGRMRDSCNVLRLDPDDRNGMIAYLTAKDEGKSPALFGLHLVRGVNNGIEFAPTVLGA